MTDTDYKERRRLENIKHNENVLIELKRRFELASGVTLEFKNDDSIKYKIDVYERSLKLFKSN